MINVPFPPIIPAAFSPEHLSEIIEALEAVPADVDYLCFWLLKCNQSNRFKLSLPASTGCTNWITAMLGSSGHSLNSWIIQTTGYTPRSSDKDMLAYRLAWAQHLLNYLKGQL